MDSAAAVAGRAAKLMVIRRGHEAAEDIDHDVGQAASNTEESGISAKDKAAAHLKNSPEGLPVRSYPKPRKYRVHGVSLLPLVLRGNYRSRAGF